MHDGLKLQSRPSGAAEFRIDVNGLRAWAVIAVILYHFELAGFDGGFVGVDIFFVISGFLMTGILVRNLEGARLSIFDFYVARAKRIIPALAVLCATLLLAGYFFIQPSDYKTLATHVAYSLSFLSNIEYWLEAGYFDAASHEKWLLHTWSLSVEWQFYLLLPVGLALFWKFAPSRSALLYAIATTMIASFAVCFYQTENSPSAAFFLLTSRAWEMLAGGLAFLLADRFSMSARLRALLCNSGLLLLFVSNLVFDKNSAWPGVGAALPVLGTTIILLVNHPSSLLNNRLAQWLGDRSYSLYLWHWPLYVALVFVEMRGSPLALTAGLLLTVVAGHLSYMLVEKPTKEWFANKRSIPVASAIAVIVAAVAIPAVVTWRMQGWSGRFPPSVEMVAQEAENSNPRKLVCHTQSGAESAGCEYGNGSRKVIVLGDSHADAVVTGVASALNGQDVKVLQISYSGCPFVEGMRKVSNQKQSKDYRCIEFTNNISRTLAVGYDGIPVILVNRYAAAAMGKNEERTDGQKPRVFFTGDYVETDREYIEEFSQAIVRTACNLAKNRPVYLMRPIPEMGVNIPKTLARRISFGMEGEMSISRAEYRARNDWVWRAQDLARDRCGARILDPTIALCSDDRCYGSKHGRPLYYDDNHLSEYGNKLLVPMYAEVLRTN